MTGKEAVEYIDTYWLHQTQPSLHRINDLMNRLGNPHLETKYIHVAGTNGKGSTCAMLASILQQAGYKTGLFTSPHILHFGERMQVNGVPISDEELAEITEFVRPHAEAMEEPVNEFELITAIGFTYFARQHCDIVVLEVGLGGEFDATNIIPAPECAVIMNIGLDHTALLGNTIPAVARCKAGIIKPGCDVVVYRGDPAAETVFEEVCAEKGARLHKPAFGSIRSLSVSIEGQTFDAAEYKALFLPLAGEHQQRNATVALTAVEVLRQKGWNIGEEPVRRGLRQVKWPVRFEVVDRHPVFIIDGGHNPQCLEAVREGLRTLLPGRRVVFLTGVLADKDVGEMASLLGEAGSEYVTVTPNSPRAMGAEELAVVLRRLGKEAHPCQSIQEGIEKSREMAGKDGVVCCVGSLYLAGEVRSHFS
ncbi:MAG: bifunctional folylpolyglutamate synthase/dihydrofolate synthase [Ruminococcaceae bacterium]|nr:bifunctional folylpolyglutamate synthase/dihydrofolate synthase [Oscillospiraceae bacterium]